jgi:hypothetical protein
MNHPSGIEIVTRCRPGLIAELVAMQQSAFPPRMQFGNPEQYYAEGLADAANINVLLRSPDGTPAGYLLAIPQDRVCAELQQWDSEMPGDPSNIYVDLIQTLPGRRRGTALKALVIGFCQEARVRGFARLSAHVRTSIGLHSFVQKALVDCRCLRHLDDWYGSGETFAYIEAHTLWKPQQG